MDINERLYEGIKKRLTDDIILAYEVFKNEQYPDLKGVVLALNSLGCFGSYIINNSKKLNEFSLYIADQVDFEVRITFSNDFEDGFYPLLEK